MDLLKKLTFLFSAKEKKQALGLFLAMVIGAFLEAFGIGAILPFMGLVSDPQILEKNAKLLALYERTGFHNKDHFIFAFGVFLLLVFFLKNIYLYYLLRAQNKFVFDKEASLSTQLLSRYLNQPFSYHLNKNSAVLINNLNHTSRLFNGVLLPGFIILSEFMVLISILVMLLLVRPLPALVSAVVLGVVGASLYFLVKKKLRAAGEAQHFFAEQMLKWANQGLGGIKETKVLNKEKFFVNKFLENVKGYAVNTQYIQVTTQIPRLVLEVLIMVILVLAVFATLVGNANRPEFLATLSLFGLAAVRLMPSLNRIVSNLSVIRACKHCLDIVYSDMQSFSVSPKQSAEGPDIHFYDKIELRNLSYRYPSSHRDVFTQFNLTIQKGESVAFIGPSGAGKTTLVDIMLGLLLPTQGGVFVDGINIRDNITNWQTRIGYIPQNIYLSDDTIRANVAFGCTSAEDQKVWNALKSAQLFEFVQGLPEGLDTFVGERGIRMSGGQRQRLGIARAFYLDPEILILDEATSSLDSETEKEITKAIDLISKEKTLLVIAHRLSTAQHCKKVYQITDGAVSRQGSYEDVVNPSV